MARCAFGTRLPNPAHASFQPNLLSSAPSNLNRPPWQRYERETGGTANVFLAAEQLGGERRDVVFKLRTGEVTEEERDSSRLVEAVGARCGLLRPSIALEWVAEIETIAPLGRGAGNATVATAAMARAARRPAVAAELARGVSVDMLLRSHAQGPNKQDEQGLRARRMVQRLCRLDSRSLVHAALFDLLVCARAANPAPRPHPIC